MSPRVGVLALQGGVAEHERMLASLVATPVRVRRPHDLLALDALVVPGGESSVLDRLLDVAGLRASLTDAIRDGLPTLGTCAGLVLLATTLENPAPGQRTLGILDIAVRRNAFGRQVDSAEVEASWLPGTGSPLRAAAIRAPEVTAWGEGVEVVSTMTVASADGSARDAVVGVRQGSVTAISLHPELTGDPTAHLALLEGQRSWTSTSKAWVTAGSPTALAPPPRIPSSSCAGFGKSSGSASL